MLLSIFVVLVVLALILLGLGYAVREGAYSIIGFVFLFVLSTTIIMPGNMQYESGKNVTAPCNCTEDRYNISTIITVEQTTYSYWDDTSSQWFGIWLAMISAIGMFITSVEVYKSMNSKEDD